MRYFLYLCTRNSALAARVTHSGLPTAFINISTINPISLNNKKIMKKNSTPAATAATAATPAAHNVNPIQEFLQTEYEFRRNLLSGKIEFRVRIINKVSEEGTNGTAEGEEADFRPFTTEDLNSIILAVEQALPDEKRLRDRVSTIVNSRITPDYDPAADWLHSLPDWDGKNHVGALCDRIPGLRAEQRYWLHIWLRSVVAHWLQMDSLHGNEVVPTLIGDQGCGKSTFCRLLLPEPLREYFLDHVNLANKFDKEMALTNNLLVNIDELDQVRRSRQTELKQLLSKSRVNGRPIWGRTQQDRPRYASFVATTNNLHPLHDPTGSRRFLCIEIPSGRLMDNETPSNYAQLYAQLLDEIRKGERYWFTEEETRALQRANAAYQSTLDLERIVCESFRKPKADEPCTPLAMSAIVEIIQRSYSFVQPTHSTKIQLGLAFAAQGFECRRESFGCTYLAVPKTDN